MAAWRVGKFPYDAKCKQDAAKDVDTDVDDNFVSNSSASDGESERDNSDIQEVNNARGTRDVVP